MKLIHKLLIVALFWSPFARAAEAQDKQFFLGANLGYSFLNQGLGSHFAYGLSFDARINPAFQIGTEFRRATLSTQDDTSQFMNLYLINALYRMPSPSGNFSIGAELGEASLTTQLDVAGLSLEAENSSKFCAGSKASYDQMLSSHWQAGVRWIIFGFSRPQA